MIQDTLIPKTQDNAETLANALDGRPPSQLVSDYIKSINEALRDNPRLFRAFGPWWWSIKILLNESGEKWVGNSIEMDTYSRYHYESPVNTVVSASVYFDDMMTLNRSACSTHVLPLPSGDSFVYELVDLEMEAYID